MSVKSMGPYGLATRLAIQCGLSMHRLGIRSFPFAWLKERATIFYILNTLVHGDDIEWHGDDLFVEGERGSVSPVSGLRALTQSF